MWKEALFSATLHFFMQEEAMWNKNLIFGGAISWNQAITLCPGNARRTWLACWEFWKEYAVTLPLFCIPSYRQHIPHTHTHNAGKFTKASRDTFLGESTAVWLCCIKNELSFECGGEWIRLERLIGRDACDISFCFPTAEVTCCCGSTDAWRVRGLFMRECVF